MTTQQFIYNNVGETRADKKFCSSVMVDNNGIVYSYGYHYPLAWIRNGQGYVNTAGYSNTTARHISWARRALGDKLGYNNVYGVELPRGADVTNQANITKALEATRDNLLAIMATKKRRDTRVYQDLTERLQATNRALIATNSFIN